MGSKNGNNPWTQLCMCTNCPTTGLVYNNNNKNDIICVYNNNNINHVIFVCICCPTLSGQDEVVARLERILANVTGTEPGTATLTSRIHPSFGSCVKAH
jgi:hypothetical protein